MSRRCVIFCGKRYAGFDFSSSYDCLRIYIQMCEIYFCFLQHIHGNVYHLWFIIIFEVDYHVPMTEHCYHHHHVVPSARISLTLSRHISQSFIASGRSSRLHPVSSHCYCTYVRAGPPAFSRPYVGIHRCTSLMSSSLLFQQCSACLVRLTWIVFVMGDKWPYSWGLVGCCCQDLFNIAGSILV